MSESKKYYWIKLKANFFDLETIDWLLSQDNGCEYVVLYQKLCLLTANKDGEMVSSVGEMLVPYDAKKIARDAKFSFDTVVVALELFKKIGLIYEQENGILKIPYVKEMVGSESEFAQKKREYRNRIKQSEQKLIEGKDNQKTMSETMSDKSIEYRDKSLEYRDKEKELESHSDECDISHAKSKPKKKIFGEYQNVKLTDEEYQILTDEFGEKTRDEYIDRLSGYIASKGDKYKSHNATIRNWMKKDGIGKKADRNAIPEGCYRDENGTLRGRYGEIII